MNDWIYLGAIVFGAVSLLIEADRNYRTTLGNTPFPYHAILKQVELENLCTPREWMSGFLFYSLLYLLAYAIILSSTELFLLVRNANLAELEVGAHTEFVGPLSDPLELAGTTYGKPIFVSAFLIAFLSVGAMKPVEMYIRALAHRLAGVPRGVYRVLEKLQKVRYRELNAQYPSPLLKKFNAACQGAGFKELSDQYIEDIQTQLSTIDCLSPSVTAGFSRLHFPLTHFDAFKDVPQQLSKEIDEVDQHINTLQPTEASMKELHEKVVLASNSAKAVFAVFYVRNNHAIKNTDPESPIATIEKQITRGYQTELNSFAMSMFVGVLVSLIVAFASYHKHRSEVVDDRPSLAQEQIEAAWNKATPEKVLNLPGEATVTMTFEKGTEGMVKLDKGLIMTPTIANTYEDEDLKLKNDTEAKVSFPAPREQEFTLDVGSEITIKELPALNAKPQLNLPLKSTEAKPTVTLPKNTVAIITLGEDKTVKTEMPEKADAKLTLDGKIDATYPVEKSKPTEVTLKAGQKISVKLLTKTPALLHTNGDEPHAELSKGAPIPMPTLSACLANLTTTTTTTKATDQSVADDKGKDKAGATKNEEKDTRTACEKAAEKGKNKWLTGQYSRFAKWSFWDVLQRGLMVFATIVATIFFREVRVDQNSWKPWSFKRIPFLRLLSMSISPAIIGVFALSSAFVLDLFWESGFNVTQRQVTELFQNSWIYFAWHLIPCMILSIAALILMDKHDDWPVEVSLLVAVICAGMLIALSWVIYTMTNPTAEEAQVSLGWLRDSWTIDRRALRDTIVTAIMPSVFILLFAAFLELTEESEKSNWLTVRMITALRRSKKPSTLQNTVKSLVFLLTTSVIAASFVASSPTTLHAQGAGVTQGLQETSTGSPHPESQRKKKLLRIGVRSHARPFSYQSDRKSDVFNSATTGPLGRDRYTGFMVKICDAVLTDLLANPITRTVEIQKGQTETQVLHSLVESDIETINVDNLVAQNPDKSRFEYFGSHFDILCDPSTITNERRNGLMLSPPLFLSGISFIVLHDLQRPKRDGCPSKPLIGVVGNTTAVNGGILAILKANELPAYRNLLIDWLDDGKNQCPKSKETYEAVKTYSSHAEAAKAFCGKKFHFYLGDQEIIIHNARQIPGCEFDQAARTFTTDRYAIFGKIDYEDADRQRWVTRFFEVLSQKVPFSSSVLDTAFSDTFFGTDKSRALELFFWSVRGPN